MSVASETFVLPTGQERPALLARVHRTLDRLDSSKRWVVTIAMHKPKRSNDQNALLWALYDDILKRGGEELGGWERSDLHEFFLGENFGWVLHEGMGAKRKKPARRSSGLTKQEFTDFIDFIVRYMAQRGVVLQLPGDAGADQA